MSDGCHLHVWTIRQCWMVAICMYGQLGNVGWLPSACMDNREKEGKPSKNSQPSKKPRAYTVQVCIRAVESLPTYTSLEGVL